MKTHDYSRETLERINELSEENREKFDEIFIKIQFAHIDVHDRVVFLNDCLDKFQKAEEQKVLPEKVFGTYDFDLLIKKFVLESRKSYSLLLKIYWEIYYIPLILLIYLGLFEMGIEIMDVWAGQGFTYNIRVNTSMIINTFLVIIIYNILLRRKAHWFYMKFISTHKWKIRICLFIVWIIMVEFLTVSKRYMSVYLFSINYFIFLCFLIILYIVKTLIVKYFSKH